MKKSGINGPVTFIQDINVTMRHLPPDVSFLTCFQPLKENTFLLIWTYDTPISFGLNVPGGEKEYFYISPWSSGKEIRVTQILLNPTALNKFVDCLHN
jgi:hypothetical protein